MDRGRPSVAASPGRVFLVFGGILAIFVLVVFNLFVVEDNPEPVVSDTPIPITPQNEVSAPVETFEPPAPPPLPVTDFDPAQPVVAPPPLEIPDDGPTNELLRERLRSDMLVSSGRGGSILPDFGGNEEGYMAGNDPNLAFAQQTYSGNTRATTKAAQAEAGHMGALSRTVGQGKVIDAVLETAINTDLPGDIRAIVSRDIFPETGNYRIIPKGSRLVGTYNSSLIFGQSRVYVVWTRVIRPDGVDVMLNSPLIDQIGQAGVAGNVDTKFTEVLTRAALTSSIAISVAIAAAELAGDETTTTQNENGETVTTGDAASMGIIEATENFGAVMESFLRRYINVSPTIIVDQGTPVKVMVKRDLVFPPQYAGQRILP
jgi:type IV secretion system protein VirB10